MEKLPTVDTNVGQDFKPWEQNAPNIHIYVYLYIHSLDISRSDCSQHRRIFYLWTEVLEDQVETSV